jgi:hypothetical protein
MDLPCLRRRAQRHGEQETAKPREKDGKEALRGLGALFYGLEFTKREYSYLYFAESHEVGDRR